MKRRKYINDISEIPIFKPFPPWGETGKGGL